MFRYVMLWCALLLVTAESWAVRPYTPVHPDPVLEKRRWTVFPELKGKGLTCMAEDRAGSMAGHGPALRNRRRW